jgi:putative polyhydroxyalkanoate system protein
MADIHIHRTHTLGLTRARKVAWKWAEDAEEKFGMECTVIEADDSDVVEFKRSGVEGTLVVSADAFELKARLGLLVGAFRHRIEREIEENLDSLLARSAKAAAPAKAARSAAAKKKR